MKLLFAAVSILAVSAAFSASVRAQDDLVRMSISTELKNDPEQMAEAEAINPGDPMYLVFKISPKYKYTLKDFASTDPKTGEKNVFICFDMNSYKVGQICQGILKSPLSDQDLSRKSAVFTLVPATNDMNAENIKTIAKVMDMIDSKSGQDFDLRVTYENYDLQKSASFKVSIPMADYAKSRWKQYSDAFSQQNWDAQKQRELVATTIPAAAMHDPVIDKQLAAAAESLLGGSNKIYKTVITSSGWTYQKNEFGIMLSRAVYVAIMRKETASGDCIVDTRLYAKQEYITGNSWASLRLWWRDNPVQKYIDCSKFTGPR